MRVARPDDGSRQDQAGENGSAHMISVQFCSSARFRNEQFRGMSEPHRTFPFPEIRHGAGQFRATRALGTTRSRGQPAGCCRPRDGTGDPTGSTSDQRVDPVGSRIRRCGRPGGPTECWQSSHHAPRDEPPGRHHAERDDCLAGNPARAWGGMGPLRKRRGAGRGLPVACCRVSDRVNL